MDETTMRAVAQQVIEQLGDGLEEDLAKEELRKAFQENVTKHDAALKHDAPIVQLVCTKPHAKQLRRDLINKTLGDHVVTWSDLFKSLWAAAGVAQ